MQFSYSHEGWGSILTDLYARKADIVLRGYAGWNSRRALQVLEQVFPKGEAVQPSLVIVYFGGNDSANPNPTGLGSHVPLDEYVENMKKIAVHLKSLSENMRVIFLTTPPVNETQIREVLGELVHRRNETCQKYSEACVKLCQELDVKVIDLWTALQQRNDWLAVCFTDGIHLSPEGSKIVVKEILKALIEAEWKPSLHWKSLPAEFDEASPDGTNVDTSQSIHPWHNQWD